jgi:glutathione S-transferase
MKIHLDPTSTTSLPILLFLAEHDTSAEVVTVTLAKGEHMRPEYAALNPNRCVPTLEEGDFILTESSAILKYLAEMARSPTYPQDLRARARVNEVMDWFNTGFYRDLGYGFVYPQALPKLRFSNPATQADVVHRGEGRAVARLSLLNDHWLGDGGFVCGPELTIADYLGSCYVAIVDWIGYDIGGHPNVMRWMSAMRTRPSWEQTHDPWNTLVANLRMQQTKPAANDASVPRLAEPAAT